MKWDTELQTIGAKTKYPIGDGDHGSIKPAVYQSQGVPYIRVGDITKEGYIDKSKMVYIPEEVNEANPKSFLYPGDIVISKTGATIGKVAIIPEDMKIANTTASIGKVTLDLDLALPKYVLWCMKSHYFQSQMWRVSHKSAQPGFNVKDLKKFKIPLPRLDQQKQIAQILDMADAYRQKTKSLIEKYDELTQSLFLEMFGNPVTNPKGFEIVTVRDIIEEAKYGTSSKADENGTFPYLRMNNITYEGHMNYDNLKFINMADDQLHKYETKRGDILFNRTNSKELVGKTGIITTDEKMILAGYLIRVRMKEGYNPYFLWSHLNSRWAKLTLENMCKNIVGMANINAQELQNIIVMNPPLKIQNQFAERVQAIESQKALAQRELDKAEELFNSLLQKAFKGELV